MIRIIESKLDGLSEDIFKKEIERGVFVIENSIMYNIYLEDPVYCIKHYLVSSQDCGIEDIEL